MLNSIKFKINTRSTLRTFRSSECLANECKLKYKLSKLVTLSTLLSYNRSLSFDGVKTDCLHKFKVVEKKLIVTLKAKILVLTFIHVQYLCLNHIQSRTQIRNGPPSL